MGRDKGGNILSWQYEQEVNLEARELFWLIRHVSNSHWTEWAQSFSIISSLLLCIYEKSLASYLHLVANVSKTLANLQQSLANWLADT